MLTSSAEASTSASEAATTKASQPKPTRPSSKPFWVTVSRILTLTPHFTRVTFTGPSLEGFLDEGLDQRIKVVLPAPSRRAEESGFEALTAATAESGNWWTAWKSLDPADQNPFRTYTARAIRRAEHEVDVDFVVHGDAGPASAWVGRAKVGDELLLIGPDAASGWSHSGIEWEPRGARTVLLAGDETAVPAIAAILETLGQDARGCVFLEVPSAADRLTLTHPDSVDVHWLPRDADVAPNHDTGARARHGALLDAAVRDWTSRFLTATHHGAATDEDALAEIDIDHEILWEVPDGTNLEGDFYAWLAGEAGAITELRRFLVKEVGIHRSQVAFMGYWRLGKSEN